MPSGLSKSPGLKEKCLELFGSDKPYQVGIVAGPLVIGALIGQVFKDEAELARETPLQVQAKAAQLWRENGYEVLAFKSYEVRANPDRSVTLILKNKSDGKTYEGLADCSSKCGVRKITAL